MGDAALHIDPAALGEMTEQPDGRYAIALPDGRHAVLTLDPALQQAADAVLARARPRMGAVAVMALDGRILALAGRKGQDREHAMATNVWAPAASIFKIVTAAALVDAGVRPGQRVCYHGGLRSVRESNLRDDPARDKRCNDLGYGISHSQNAVIAKLAHRHLDPDRLRQVADAFGFNDAPAFALATQPNRADIPDAPLDFARVAAGFWQTELSPLGGSMVAAVIATGGMSVTPRIVARLRDGQTELPVEPVTPVRVIPEHVARDVAHMMVATTETGTARKGFRDRRGRRFFPTVDVAGKTGTLTRRAPDYVQYSWFVGFAPAEEPRVAIAVLLGNPERWHLKAHTAARIVLQAALN